MLQWKDILHHPQTYQNQIIPWRISANWTTVKNATETVKFFEKNTFTVSLVDLGAVANYILQAANRGKHHVWRLPTRNTSYFSFGMPQRSSSRWMRVRCGSLYLHRAYATPVKETVYTDTYTRMIDHCIRATRSSVLVSHHDSREGGGLSLRAPFEKAKVE